MATQQFLAKAYLAYFGRPVDPIGAFAFKDASETEVFEAFFASPESQALYGTGFGETQITAIYQMLFNRDPEPAGLDYWLNQITLGLLTPAGAALGILNGARNEDAVAVANKLSASGMFTASLDTLDEVNAYVGDAAAAHARAFLKSVGTLPLSQAQVEDSIEQLIEINAPGVIGKPHLFTLTDNFLVTDDVLADIEPVIKTVTYIGFNPHAHGETGVDNLDGNNPDGNDNNLTNETIFDGGVPLYDLDADYNPVTNGQNVVQKGLISYIKDLTGMDFVQLGLINIANGQDDGQGNDYSEQLDALSGVVTIGDQIGDSNTVTVTVTAADGTIHTAEVDINNAYFKLLTNLVFDEESNLRLFEKEIAIYEQADVFAGYDAHGQAIYVPQNVYKYVSEAGSVTIVPIVLTNYTNNGGTVEKGVNGGPYVTTDANDVIVAGRLELLHQAYIDAGAGHNTLEVDAKGYYAQPLALTNIQHVKVHNLPNVYTDGSSSGGGSLPDSTYPDLTDVNSDYKNSVLDLTRAIDIETLTITESNFEGLSGTGQEIPGSLTVAGIRNGAEVTLDGSFSQNVYLNFGELQGNGVDLVLNNVNFGEQGGYNSNELVVAHNSNTLNIESTGGDNFIANGDLVGSGNVGGLSTLNVTGDAHLFIEGDLDDSFHDGHPVVINAAGNSGGVNLTLSGSENVTFTGSTGNDIFRVDTSENNWNNENDTSVTINGGVGDNRYEVDYAYSVNITNADGNNNYEVDDAIVLNIQTGNGNNRFEIDDIQSATLVAGNGNNRFEVYAWNSEDSAYPSDSFDVPVAVSITAGNGKNDIDVEADYYIGTVTVTVGNGGNAVNVESATISVTAGTGADDIRVEGRDITVNAGGSNNTVTVVGTDEDYTDNVEGNGDNDGAPYASDAGALIKINAGTNSTVILGSGDDPQEDEGDGFPGTGDLTAKVGSSITGTNVKLVVDTIADLRAATLSGITSVVLDDDASSYAASGTANAVIDPQTGLPTNDVSRAVLTVTLSQFLALGADAFSVDGAIFNTHAYVRVIVDANTSLTAMGVADLPRNIDLLLEVQDGVTLSMTAEQLHTKVAPQGVTLAWDGNTDSAAGKVVITNGGDDFDPFNTNDTVRTTIGGNVYYGGSLSSDFAVDGSDSGTVAGNSKSEWYNVTVSGGYGGYNRPADAPVEVVWTIDGDAFPSVGAISTWNYNIEIIGGDDVTFTGALNAGVELGANATEFTVDFSQLEGEAINLTLGNFENVGAVYGNSNNGYTSVVNVELDHATDKTVGHVDNDGTGSDQNVGLVSSGVTKYVVTKIGGPTAPGSAGSTATIVLCDTTQDLEVLALRGNWNDTLEVIDAPWGLVFELQGGSTAKADGPTGYANVGVLDATFQWEGADAVVNLVHSVAGDTRAIYAKGITVDNADSITVDAGASSAVIYNIGGDDVSELNFASDANVSISTTLGIASLSSISGANVDGAFTLALSGTADGAGFDFVASAGTTTLTLNSVSAGTHSSFSAEDAATFNLVVNGTTNLSAATLTNVDALSLGTIGVSTASSVTLSAAQALDIGAANITLTHPGLLGSLNLVNLGSEAFDAGDLGDGVTLGTVSIASGNVTLHADTVLTGATVTVAKGSSLTLTADQFMALAAGGLDGAAANATIHITGLTQDHIDDGFTLSGVSNAKGSVSLAEDVVLASTTSLNGFSVTLADGQTISLATSAQASGLEVNGGADTTVKFLFTTGTGIDVDSYDVTTLLIPAALVAGTNVDAVLVNLPQDVVKTIYNDVLPMVDQTVTLQPGVTVAGSMSFNHANTGVELQDFTLNLTGGNLISGGINLAVTPKATGQIQTYLNSVTINSDGTEGNLASGETDNIITGSISPMDNDGTGTAVDNELLDVTINASQNLQIASGIVFEANINTDEVATLTVNGTANVTIGTLDTSSNEVDGLNVINNGTGTLSVKIDGGITGFDGSDELSFTGTGDIVLTVAGTVDLSDDDLSAVSDLVLAQNAIVTLTMAQGDAIGAGDIVLASGATAATLNLEGLDGEPFAVANYATGITVGLLTLSNQPVITLHADTDLSGINGLVVPEGTVLNLTAAQFKQLGSAVGNSGTIVGIKADGITATSNFTVNVTGLTQADVAKGFDLGGVTAANLSLTLAESVAMTTPSPLPTDWDDFDLNGADVSIGGFTLTLEQVSLADGLNITGTAGSVLKFTDIVVVAADYIDASGFDVSELHMTTQLVAGQNVDLLFEGLAASVTKVIYDDYGYIVGTNQTVVVDAGSTISGNVAFIKQEGGVEILDFTMNFEGGVQLSGNVNLSAADAGVLIPLHLQSVTINSTGTAANTLNGATANVITGNITAAALADVDPVTAGAQPTEENNLLDVTINASQDLVIGGSVVFNSVTGDDTVFANDVDDAVALLTVTGAADVSIGGIDTSDDDVDGLDVVNSGTGTLSITVNAASIDADDELSFTGTGDIELTTIGAIDFSDDDLSAVSSIQVVEDNGAVLGELTISYAQLLAVGVENITVIDSADAGTVVGNASLFINGYTGGAFSATALDTHFDAVEITLADQDVSLDLGVDLTNVTKIWVAEGRTLTLSAAQFQQLKDNGAIDGYDTGDTGTTVGPFNLVITSLTQDEVNRDLDAVDDFAEADDGFSLASVNTHGGSITITLGEPEVTLGKMVDGVLVTGSESVLLDASTTPVKADFVLTAGQTLGLVNSTQADGLVVTGAANSTVVFRFEAMDGADTSIDASDYNVTMLKALATFVGGQNAETLILGLPNAVIEQYYADANELGFVTATNRLVVVEAGVTVPAGLIYNDLRDTVELRTLSLTMLGGSTVAGDLNLSTNTESVTLQTRFFDTLTLVSSGASTNTITGDISAAALVDADPLLVGNQASTENNLLNVVINATQDLVIGTYTSAGLYTSGGDIVFNNRATVATDDVAATLTIAAGSTGDVTMHGLDVTDAAGGNIDTLTVANNSTGTLTVTGGTAAILGGQHLEVLNLSGAGDIVLGSNNNGSGAEGILSDGLSLIDAHLLDGDLTLAEIRMDNTDFTLIAGNPGKTTVTVTGETLAADADGGDNVEGNDDDQLGWVFDMSEAGVGSELHLVTNTYTSGDLNIDLGANTTLYIDADTNLTTLNSLLISGVKSIVLADEVTLTLTAAQATGLKIVAGTDTDNDGNRGTVNIVDLMSDTAANNRVYDFGDIAQEVAGTITFAAGVDDVTLDALTDLGFFSVTLNDINGWSWSLAGQTIRFATEPQATRDVLVNDLGNDGDSSSNVVWLFNSISAAGGINTSGYDDALGRLWFSDDLLNAEGGLVESLFTTLPSSILRVDFADLTALNILLASNSVSRTVEFVNFTDLVTAPGTGNLTFSDVGQDPEEHIENLTLQLGGQVEIGNILIDDVVAAADTDPTTVEFDTLTIVSNRALHEDHYLAAEAYLNDNDGSGEFRDGIDADLLNDDPENTQPADINTVGNIGVGLVNGIDLLDVRLDTLGLSTVGNGSQGSGARLQVGTITFESAVDPTPLATPIVALLDVTGANDININSVNTADADITGLTVDATGFSGVLTAPGTSPGFNLDNTDTLTFVNDGGAPDVQNFTLDFVPFFAGDLWLVDGAADTVSIFGVTIPLVAGDTGVDIAAAFASGVYADWTAVDNGLGQVTFTANEVGTMVPNAASGASVSLVSPLSMYGSWYVPFNNELAGLNGEITLGSATHAGVAGNELSFIDASGYDGELNLGTVADLDRTNDNRNGDADITDAGDRAFNFTSGTGVTTMTLGALDGDTPTLNAGSEWRFDFTNAAAGSYLKITPTVVLTGGSILTLVNVPLVIEGAVNLTQLVDVLGTATITEGLIITGGSIEVLAASSLTLTYAQVLALTGAGVSFVGAGTLKVTGPASNLADLNTNLFTVGVDLSGVTLIAEPTAGFDADAQVIVTLTGADDDNDGTTDLVGQTVTGSANVDVITTGDDVSDTLSGGAGNDQLDGGINTDPTATFDTYNVTAGTDAIAGLDESDVLVVSAGATADAALTADFVASAATVNAGTVILTGGVADDTTIDMTLATGANGFNLVGGTSATLGTDTLIGSSKNDTINGGNLAQGDALAADVLTGNDGDDIFVFEIDTSDPVALTVAAAPTVAGDDLEQWDFDPQAFGAATGFVGDADGLQALTVNYRNNGTLTSFTINDDNTIAFNDGDVLAQRIASELSSRGVSATYDTATDLLSVNGAAGQSVEIVSLTPVVGTWANPTPGDDTPIQVVGYDAANDDPQETDVTVGDGASGPAIAGEIYEITVALAEGSSIAYEFTALGGETEIQLATALATGLNGLGVGQFMADNSGGTTNVVTITDTNGDNGGFTVTATSAGGVAGTGASNLGAGAGVWADIDADVITDFISGDDRIQLNIADGTNTNYREDTVEVSYMAAFTAAEAAFTLDAAVRYYLTSIDGSTGTETATGLLFFDANGDQTTDGVILLTGVSSANFDETDIML